jgi:hypothetical protein
MKRGEVITIYKDPITRKKVEGEAKLVRRLNIMSDENLELWEVHFTGDSPGHYVERVVFTDSQADSIKTNRCFSRG